MHADQALDDALFDPIREATAPIFLALPDVRLLSTFALSVSPEQISSDIHLLTRPCTFKAIESTFLVTSCLAELESTEKLQIATRADLSNNLAATPDSTTLFLKGQTESGVCSPSDAALSSDLYDMTVKQWETATPQTLSYPSLSTMIDTLPAVSDAVANDFEASIETLLTETAPAPESVPSLNPVELTLLLTAKNQNLLYDLSRWGSDQGIASISTFSRVKSKLEEEGLIETKKVPLDIGRPRQRLILAVNSLKDHTDALETDQVAFPPSLTDRAEIAN